MNYSDETYMEYEWVEAENRLGDFCDIWGRVFDNLGSLASVRFSHLSLIFWVCTPIFV